MEELEEGNVLDNLLPDDTDEQVEEQPIDEQQPESEELEDESPFYEALDVIQSFGIEDGMVEYGGEKVHISQLDYHEQLDIIGQLREVELERLSNIPEFDDSEREVLKEAYSNGMSLVEYINAVREQDRLNYERELETILMQERLERELLNVEDLSDDEVMLYHLKNTLDDVSDRELQEALEERKALSTYNKEVGKLRTQLTTQQEQIKEQQIQQEQIAKQEYVEENYQRSYEAVERLDEIVGFELNIDEKNKLLSAIAEVDNDYETYVTKTVMTNPQLQAKAVWFLTHEQELSDYINGLHEQINKVAKEAYNKGVNSVYKSKFPSTPPVKSTNTVQVNNKNQSNVLDELY